MLISYSRELCSRHFLIKYATMKMMISYLEGKIILKKEKFVILNVNGVGYKVFLSKKALSKLPEIDKNVNPVRDYKSKGKSQGEQISNGVKVFCFLSVRETALELYGFLNQKELEFFEILDSIRGIGPKAALEISSLGSLEEIKQKILSRDEKLFEGIPGIGRKKAMAIILELTGKIKEPVLVPFSSGASADEAEEGLVNLGFSRQNAKTALSQISKDIKDPEQKIKESLKILGK